MHHLLRLMALLLITTFTVGTTVSGTPKKSKKLRPVPALIESNRRHKDVLFNAPKYDRYAKVYYLYYLSDTYSNSGFTQSTEFLAALHKKMHHTGADLILYVDYTEEDAMRVQKYKKYGYVANIPKRCKQLNAKCPIVNVYKKAARDVLFRNHVSPYGSPYSFSYPQLRAIDSYGNVLAYFILSDHSVRQMEPNNRSTRIIVNDVQRQSEWIADAIMASYQELVKQAEAKEATLTEPEEEEEVAVKKKKKKKAAKKSKPTKKTKKSKRRKHQEEEDEDEEDEEEDDEEEDDEEEDGDEDWDEE